MKTFSDLLEEVVTPGYCHHCAGCVSFCTAINYGALETGPDGEPRFVDKEKCIECGLCHMICPEVGELDQEIKTLTDWTTPIGHVDRITIARSKDSQVRQKATDGGVITSILMNQINSGRIDGAIVARQSGPLMRTPCMATTPEEILDAAGFSFETSYSMHLFSEEYSTYANSVQALAPMTSGSLEKVAFVGPPCQIKAIRKMKALGVLPADSITCLLGLFCAGNYVLGEKERAELARLGKFQWDDLKKINVKEDFMIHLKNGEIRHIRLEELDFMKRHACRFCNDYASEFADISFGGIGAEEGWTTAVIRSSAGEAFFSDAAEIALETFNDGKISELTPSVMDKIVRWSDMKKASAKTRRSS